jgi:thymidylate synthase
MRNYLDLLDKIVHHGDPRVDRTGVGTSALFTEVLEYDMADGFPLVTTKRVSFKLIKAELLWFLSGSSDVRDLQNLGCNIWNANAEAPYWRPKARFDGDLGC